MTLAVAGHLERGEALGDGHQLHRVDVDVRRQCHRPVHRLGNVVSGERLHAGVDGVRPGLVAAEPDDGEEAKGKKKK